MINLVENDILRGALHEIKCRYLSSNIYIVGGAVRDEFLGRESKDLDFLITGVPMDRLVDVMVGHGHADIAGKSFGVIKFRPAGQDEIFDIAIPRTEKSTGDKRRDFLVNADPNIPIEVDLGRRDFTVNAMAVDVFTGEIVDPYGGRQDCEDGVLRLVFPDAFVEDPTRMLRGIQQSARMGLRFHESTSKSMKANAFRISSESPERIATELCKLLTAPKPSIGFALMRSHGLLALVLPELAALSGVPQPKKYHKYDVLSHCLVACDKIPVGSRKATNKNKLVNLRLLAVLHDIGKKGTLEFKEDGTPTFIGHDDLGADMARALFARLKMTAAEGYTIDVVGIEHAIRHHMFDCDCESTAKSKRRFVAKIGKAAIFTQLRLRVADRLAKGLGVDVSEWLTFARQLRTIGHGVKAAFNVKELAINGTDVMTHLGIKPGKRVGIVLNSLFQSVLDNPELNNRETLLAMAETIT